MNAYQNQIMQIMELAVQINGSGTAEVSVDYSGRCPGLMVTAWPRLPARISAEERKKAQLMHQFVLFEAEDRESVENRLSSAIRQLESIAGNALAEAA